VNPVALSEESGVQYIKKAFRIEEHMELPDSNEGIPLPLLMFLERVMPSGWGDAPFSGADFIADKIETLTAGESALSILFPNPWIRVAPDTWPFRVQGTNNLPMTIEAWPASARHDEPRWIRSKEPGQPIATFVVSISPNRTLKITLDYHVALHSSEGSDQASTDRSLAHLMYHQQWKTDWTHIFDTNGNDEGIAMCALRRTQQLKSDAFLPGLPVAEKVRFIRGILKTRPGICEREPLAANAERMIGKM